MRQGWNAKRRKNITEGDCDTQSLFSFYIFLFFGMTIIKLGLIFNGVDT